MTWAEQLLSQGREEGHARGRLEGRRETLTTIIEAKFGPLSPKASARISDATLEELDRYVARVLSADSAEAALEIEAS